MTSEDRKSAELLIREARRLGRRRRIRQGAVVCAILLVVAALISTVVYFSQSKRPPTNAKKEAASVNYPRCTVTQLLVTSKAPVGAGGTDGAVLLFRNVSSHACSLTGFPNVEAIGKSGSSITASHVSNYMLGGWDWTGQTSPPKPPTVLLSNRNQVASDWYQYLENGPVGYSLFLANSLRIALPGSRAVVQVKGWVDAAQGRMVVTPFVPGTTGTAEPKNHPRD
jgi:hypothetical protein